MVGDCSRQQSLPRPMPRTPTSARLKRCWSSPPAERDPEGIAAWMHTVIRNEALQIVRSRKREVDHEFEVITGGLTADVALPEESLVDAETHGIAKEALRRLRPDQTRCLLLRADGFDYPEICRLTGFSYAKVNRLLSEGRKSRPHARDAIDPGRECERIEPLLSMFADGEADSAAENDVRLHLETCSHCRATVRDYKLAPRDLASLFPVGVPPSPSWRGRIARSVPARPRSSCRRGSASVNADASIAVWKKSLAVLAAGVTVVGGGAAIKKQVDQNDKPQSAPAAVDQRPVGSLVSPIEVDRDKSSARASRKSRDAASRERRSDNRKCRQRSRRA